jgi:hypothetical protein
LVRNPDKNFCPEQYGANGRRCWRDLYNHFQTISRGNNLSDVEVSLITNFCNYLESEGIVSTYEPKDLLNYAVGIKARKAVTGILYQVGSRLEKENYKIALTDEKKDSWPQLKIQHSDWQKKFGKGENWKISLWFTVPEIWEAKKHDFYFEIELWHEAHQNEWSYMKSRLPKWFEILKSENFSWSVFQKNWNSSRDNISASEIPAEPKRICVWKTHSEAILNQDGSQDEAEVISLLVEQVKKYAAVIDALK